MDSKTGRLNHCPSRRRRRPLKSIAIAVCVAVVRTAGRSCKASSTNVSASKPASGRRQIYNRTLNDAGSPCRPGHHRRQPGHRAAVVSGHVPRQPWSTLHPGGQRDPGHHRTALHGHRAARRPIVLPSRVRPSITTAYEIKYGRRLSARPSERARTQIRTTPDDKVVTEGRIGGQDQRIGKWTAGRRTERSPLDLLLRCIVSLSSIRLANTE